MQNGFSYTLPAATLGKKAKRNSFCFSLFLGLVDDVLTIDFVIAYDLSDLVESPLDLSSWSSSSVVLRIVGTLCFQGWTISGNKICTGWR
jgi:hypothetical protein